jgi:DedD protein
MGIVKRDISQSMTLDDRLKQRLLGGAVLVAVVVIFVPMLIEESVDQRLVTDHTIPEKPEYARVDPVVEKQLSRPPKIDKVEKPSHGERPDKPFSKPEKEVIVPVEQDKREKTQPKPVSQPTMVQPTTASPTAWIIQVASMTKEANATRLIKQLREANLPAQMKRVNLNGKRHYRVRVGPELDHKLAKKMLEKIEQEFKLKPKLMRYPR